MAYPPPLQPLTPEQSAIFMERVRNFKVSPERIESLKRHKRIMDGDGHGH